MARKNTLTGRCPICYEHHPKNSPCPSPEVRSDGTCWLLTYIEELEAKVEQLRVENATLHVALFHVENGLGHPDEAIRLLIQAANKAAEA